MDPWGKLVPIRALRGCAISPLPMWEKAQDGGGSESCGSEDFRDKPFPSSSLELQPTFPERRQSSCTSDGLEVSVKVLRFILALALVTAGTSAWAAKHPVPLDPKADPKTCLECHEDK